MEGGQVNAQLMGHAVAGSLGVFDRGGELLW